MNFPESAQTCLCVSLELHAGVADGDIKVVQLRHHWVDPIKDTLADTCCCRLSRHQSGQEGAHPCVVLGEIGPERLDGLH